MSEILKTEAVVLKKLDYGDSSKIITLFSEKFGKVQGIIKGARSPKSRIGAIADTLNLVNVIFYNKHGREIQFISQIDLVSNFTNLKDNLDGLKYGTAIAELFILLIADSDEHLRLYSGLKRILEVLNSNEVNYKYVFAKFLFFFIKEIGYEPHISHCAECGKELSNILHGAYNYELGIFCEECKSHNLTSFEFDKELLETVICLNLKKNDLPASDINIDKIIFFFEKYLSYHIPEFTGLKSLQVF